MSKNSRRGAFGAILVGVVFLASQQAAYAYDSEGGYDNCTQQHGTVYTYGYASPGSIQRHTQGGRIKQWDPVYGKWYGKGWNRGMVNGGWFIEAFDNGGAWGQLHHPSTDGYCIW